MDATKYIFNKEMELLSISNIVNNNKQDEAIQFLKRYKKRRPFQNLEQLSIKNIIKHDRQDEVIAYLHYIKQQDDASAEHSKHGSYNETATVIRNRQVAKDIFITPIGLAKKHINIISQMYCASTSAIWYDPFKNNGSYYNHFPSNKKYWAEILQGKNFFYINVGNEMLPERPNIIASNPPWSQLDKVLEKSVALKPDVISYLIGVNNLTAKRIEYMEKQNYVIGNIYICKVFLWFGMSYIVTWINKEYVNDMVSSFVEAPDKKKEAFWLTIQNKGVVGYDRIVWR